MVIVDVDLVVVLQPGQTVNQFGVDLDLAMEGDVLTGLHTLAGGRGGHAGLNCEWRPGDVRDLWSKFVIL